MRISGLLIFIFVLLGGDPPVSSGMRGVAHAATRGSAYEVIPAPGLPARSMQGYGARPSSSAGGKNAPSPSYAGPRSTFSPGGPKGHGAGRQVERRDVPASKLGGGHGGASGATSGSGPGGMLRPAPDASRRSMPGREIPASGLGSGLGARPGTGMIPAQRSGRKSSGRTRPKDFSRLEPIVALRLHLVVQACLYRGNEWLLPKNSEYDAGVTLAGLSPTFVTGAIFLDPGRLPTPETCANWNGLRSAVRKGSKQAGFDIVIDLREYSRPEELRAHMARAGNLLLAESWTFLGISGMSRARPELLRTAIAEAHAQGRKAGGILDSAAPPDEIFSGTQHDAARSGSLDYILVPYDNGGKALEQRISAARGGGSPAGAGGITGTGGMQVIVVNGALSQLPGAGFAMHTTPAQRRRMVMDGAKYERSGVSFAFPVFGPLAARNRAYNALRDEFMMDTVRRGIKARQKSDRR